MIEDPNYGVGSNAGGYGGAAAGGAGAYTNYSQSQEGHYEPSHFSQATGGYAGMGAYGPAAAAGAGAGAFAGYYAGSGDHQQQQYYNASQGQGGGMSGTGHDVYSDEGGYSNPGYQMQGAYPQPGQYDQYTSAGPHAANQGPWNQTYDPSAGTEFAAAGGAGAAALNQNRRSVGGAPMANPYENGGNADEGQLLGAGVFGDVSPPEGGSPGQEATHVRGVDGQPPAVGAAANANDERLGRRGSNGSLRDDQDYSRKVLAVKNPEED